MSITSELLSAVGLDDLPPSVRRLVEQEVEKRLLATYGQQIKKLEPFLFKQGQEVGAKIAAGILGAIFVDSKKMAKEAKAKRAPEWLTQIVMPAITPFIEGVKSTAMPTVKKVAVGIGSAILGAGLLGGFLIGRSVYLPKLKG